MFQRQMKKGELAAAMMAGQGGAGAGAGTGSSKFRWALCRPFGRAALGRLVG